MIDIYAETNMITIDGKQYPEMLCTVTGESTITELVKGELTSVTIPVYALPIITWELLYEDNGTSLIRIWVSGDNDDICKHPSVIAHGIESLMLWYPEHARHLLDVVYLDSESCRYYQEPATEYLVEHGKPVEVRVRYSKVGAYKSPALRPQIMVLDDDDITVLEAARKTKAEAIKIARSTSNGTPEH